MFDKLYGLFSRSSRGVDRAEEDPTGLLDSDPTGIMNTDPTGLLDTDEWFDTREIETGSGETSAAITPAERGGVAPEIAHPDEGSPLTSDFPRGTFALPRSRPFLQALENRAQNGAHEIVETAYVLTGPTYSTPNIMHPLDDPEYYERATVDSLHSLVSEMAESVASAYEGCEPPKMLGWVHTHPNGSTTPSPTDRTDAEKIRDVFASRLGTDDFEFFNGIHAFDRSLTRESTIGDRYAPVDEPLGISWHGARFEHTLVMYDAAFVNPKPMRVLTG